MLSPVLEKIVDPAHLGKSGSGLEIDLVTVDTDVETAIAHEFKVCVLIRRLPYNTRYLPVPSSRIYISSPACVWCPPFNYNIPSTDYSCCASHPFYPPGNGAPHGRGLQGRQTREPVRRSGA